MSKKAAKAKAKSSSKTKSAGAKSVKNAKKTSSQKSTKAPAKTVKKPVAKKIDKTSQKVDKKQKKVVASPPPKENLKSRIKLTEKKSAQPSLMTKKGRTIVEEVESLKEGQGAEESLKAEKVSKIKPIRVERGNLADEKAKWAEVNRKYGKDKAPTYKMSETFPAMSPIQHKVLGWGFVLTNENDRLEILFETGIRMLISNYKSS